MNLPSARPERSLFLLYLLTPSREHGTRRTKERTSRPSAPGRLARSLARAGCVVGRDKQKKRRMNFVGSWRYSWNQGSVGGAERNLKRPRRQVDDGSDDEQYFGEDEDEDEANPIILTSCGGTGRRGPSRCVHERFART